MLCISMKVGDYFTVGDDTVVQFDDLVGERARIMVTAPREVPILRGELLERSSKRPGCVLEKSKRYVRQLPWDHAKKQALLEMREALSQMGDRPETQYLQKRLDYIFPQQQ